MITSSDFTVYDVEEIYHDLTNTIPIALERSIEDKDVLELTVAEVNSVAAKLQKGIEVAKFFHRERMSIMDDILISLIPHYETAVKVGMGNVLKHRTCIYKEA